MRAKFYCGLILAVAAASFLILPACGLAQQPADEPHIEQRMLQYKLLTPVHVDMPYKELTVRSPGAPIHAIMVAAAKARDAEGDDAKAEAKEELADLLDKYFEADMKRRAEDLAKIEERVKKLHALMEKRNTKKQEIIDLQMKVLEYDANGLGLFSDAGPDGQLNPFRGLPPETVLRGNSPRADYGGGGFGGGAYGTIRGRVREALPPKPAKPVKPARPARPDEAADPYAAADEAAIDDAPKTKGQEDKAR